MKIIRPRYGHPYYNDMDKTLYTQGGFILKLSYTDADTLSDEHVIFQFIPKSAQAFYVKKMNNTFLQ